MEENINSSNKDKTGHWMVFARHSDFVHRSGVAGTYFFSEN